MRLSFESRTFCLEKTTPGINERKKETVKTVPFEGYAILWVAGWGFRQGTIEPSPCPPLIYSEINALNCSLLKQA